LSDMLSFRYRQFSGLSYEFGGNPLRDGQAQWYSYQRLMPSFTPTLLSTGTYTFPLPDRNGDLKLAFNIL